MQFKPPIARKRKRNGSQVYRPPQKEPPPCGCVGRYYFNSYDIDDKYNVMCVYVISSHNTMYADVSILCVVSVVCVRNVREDVQNP